MLNEDDFLQLEAFLSPCEDPIMSIGGTIINSNDEDEVSPSTCKDTSQRAARRKQEGDSSCEYEDSGDDVVEESSFEVAEDDDDEEY